MDTFMDKLAEKINAQSAAAVSGFQASQRGADRFGSQQNIIKKQQVQQTMNGNMILEEVRNISEKQREELISALHGDRSRQVELIRQTAEELKKQEAEQAKKIEEYVHKESVKCYRNMQAVMLEQTAEIAAKQEKNRKMLLIWSVVTTVLLLAETGLVLTHILGLL